MASEHSNIKVVIRLRPYNRRELEQNQRCIIQVIDKTTLVFDPVDEDDEFFFQGAKQNYRDFSKRLNKKLNMEFDRIYDINSTNTEIFEECTGPLIDSVLQGYNGSVFVYGATGAGKTFTMLGNNSCKGLTFLTMQDLLKKINERNATHKIDIGASYLEVYNEQVKNLFTKSGRLKLLEDANGVVVSGLALKPIQSAEQLLDLLRLGNSNRTRHPTDANAESSRSHAIFQVHLRITDRKTGVKQTVKLSMIDLAGSERAASTKAVGVRFKEGASINKSLLALGNCINKLADGLKYIPYRDSNLTRILKDSIGGNCRTLMIANISKSSLTYEDTYNTLKYASRAKKVRTTLQQNILKSNMPKSFYINKFTELLAENERLKEINKSLETKISQQEVHEFKAKQEEDETKLKEWYSKIDTIYSSLIQTQHQVFDTASNIKNSNLKRKLKEYTDVYKSILVLCGNECKELEQSDSSPVLRKEKDEFRAWRKKLHAQYKDLDELSREIKESYCSDALQNFKKVKDLEIQLSKMNTINNHNMAIHLEIVANMDKRHHEFKKACEVLQKCYEHLRANESLNDELRTDFKELQLLICSQRATVQENHSIEDLELAAIGFRLNNKRFLSNIECDTPRSNDNDKKRARYSNEHVVDVNEDTQSVNSEPYRILKRNDDSNRIAIKVNPVSSMELVANEPKAKLSPKNTLVTNILSEQIAKFRSKNDQIGNPLLKPFNINHEALVRTVSNGIQKENEKHHLPRGKEVPSFILNACTSNSARKIALSNNSEPFVRINRAATFRIKK